MAERARRVAGLILDWDGVFNNGRKGTGRASGFAEADSMGLNLLRFGLWQRDGRLPPVAIVSGETNPSAEDFARRESLQALYSRVLDKRMAIEHFCATYGVGPEQVAVVVDDANDLGVAAAVGLRFFVRRAASPLLQAYVVAHGLADYITGSAGQSHAVREVSELLLGLLGCYDAVVSGRAELAPGYRRYLVERAGSTPSRFTVDGGSIVAQ